ncbi:radA-like [Hibiscus trionum]|uniref:RadA-like n=1 Tax=Hibiscus trionum TaxID=183268 RepID=A0A9W7LVZ8_HIBTR|nr:radA-like [Hibiscus trionum]
MKVLRSIYFTQHLFLHRNLSRTPVSLSSFSRHFHSSKPRFALNSPETDGTQTTAHVWTVYEGLTGDLSTPSSRQKDITQGNESGSGDETDADFETKRNYGKAKNANLSNGDETQKAENAPYFPKGNTEGVSRKKAFSGNGLGLGDIVGNRKKGKGKVKWVCQNCGHSDGQWWGVCRSCHRSGTMESVLEGETKNRGLEYSETLARSWLPKDAGDVEPVKLIDVNRGVKKMDYRIPLFGPFGSEVARVLGGGLVPGSLVLIGGDPGVGKSTLLLQMAALIAEGHDGDQPACVVYVSGEESVVQISSRAERMKIGANELYLYAGTDIEDILVKIQPLSPRALIVDSIQTVYLKEVTGSAGGLSQVRECTSALLRFAKKTNIPVLLAGHVTKAGDIAGPRVLEHIVDAVLYLEGEKCSSHRLLRSVKNRFGSVDELGIFEMSQLGLQTVLNPSEMFLSDQNSESEFLAGVAVAVIMDGSRAFLIEIQALCVSSSTVSRHVNGIQASRADMIISVLAKQAGLKIQENAVFLNVVSGVSLTETGGDLAIAASICSSFLEFPIPSGVAFIGEIGLGGELRMVARMDKRVGTVAKLGYKKCIVPKSAGKSLASLDLGEMEMIGCNDLKEVIHTVFT